MKTLVALASGALALTITAGSASAATLIATTNNPVVESFTITFNDTNGNSLFDFDELVSMTSFVYHSVPNVTLVALLAVPAIENFTTAGYDGAYTGEIPPISWYFEKEGSVDGNWDVFASAKNWTYKLDFTAPVPLPASLPLMAVGLGAIAALRRRKQA